MKMISLLILACTIFFFSSCERPKSFEMKDGLIYQTGASVPYTGKIESFYTDGKKNFVKNYSGGKLNGTTTHWFENGQKRIELNYKNNILDGDCAEWYENGQNKDEYTMLEGNYTERRLVIHIADFNGVLTTMILSLKRNQLLKKSILTLKLTEYFQKALLK